MARTSSYVQETCDGSFLGLQRCSNDTVEFGASLSMEIISLHLPWRGCPICANGGAHVKLARFCSQLGQRLWQLWRHFFHERFPSMRVLNGNCGWSDAASVLEGRHPPFVPSNPQLWKPFGRDSALQWSATVMSLLISCNSAKDRRQSLDWTAMWSKVGGSRQSCS